MRRLLPIFRVLLAFAQESQHCTVGVMIDFRCLPQKPFASDAEKSRFGKPFAAGPRMLEAVVAWAAALRWTGPGEKPEGAATPPGTTWFELAVDFA